MLISSSVGLMGFVQTDAKKNIINIIRKENKMKVERKDGGN